jgi:transposase-like protein
MAEPHTRPTRHPTYTTAYRVTNWRAYDESLRDRGDSTLWISQEAIDDIVNLLSDVWSSRSVCDTRRMSTPPTDRDKHHRFPAEIISHDAWLYFRFCLSYRDVEELRFARGIIVTYEAIRKWCRTFGHQGANQLRRRRPRPGDTWHLDEVCLRIGGERHDLWRAVDQEGSALDVLVQRRRDKHAAKTCFRKLLKGCRDIPRVLITDQLKSYGAAKRESLL